MDCSEIFNLIDEYIEETLELSKREEYEAHIKICSDYFCFIATYKKSLEITEKIICFRMPERVEQRILAQLKNEMLTSEKNENKKKKEETILE